MEDGTRMAHSEKDVSFAHAALMLEYGLNRAVRVRPLYSFCPLAKAKNSQPRAPRVWSSLQAEFSAQTKISTLFVGLAQAASSLLGALQSTIAVPAWHAQRGPNSSEKIDC